MYRPARLMLVVSMAPLVLMASLVTCTRIGRPFCNTSSMGGAPLPEGLRW